MGAESFQTKGFWTLLSIVLTLVGVIYGAQVYTDRTQDAEIKSVRDTSIGAAERLARMEANLENIKDQLNRMEGRQEKLDRRLDRRLDTTSAK